MLIKFELKEIKSISKKECNQKTYDLSVKDNHSYNIEGIVVHNSNCTTRYETGIGVPMVSSLLSVIEVADKYGIPVIADGGIRSAGDISKALSIGADTVMLGSILAGTHETPGPIRMDEKFRPFKVYRGSASYESKIDRAEKNHVEGISRTIQYKGPVELILNQLKDGLKSSMAYQNARTIRELHAKSKWIQITNSGIIEASPHGRN